jgi:hypothetical protein
LINKIDIDSLLVVNKNRKVKVTNNQFLIINTTNRIQGKNYALIEEQKCIRCDRRFYPHMTYDGKVRNYATCPFCKSPYWNTERTRKFYERKGIKWVVDPTKTKRKQETQINNEENTKS